MKHTYARQKGEKDWRSSGDVFGINLRPWPFESEDVYLRDLRGTYGNYEFKLGRKK